MSARSGPRGWGGEAVRLHEKTLQLEPSDLRVLGHLGRWQRMLRQAAEARSALARAGAPAAAR